MADGFGPGGQDPHGSSDQNNTYHYNYSYGSGRGSAPSGGFKPPKKSTDWGEWIGIAFMMFVLPFTITKLIGGAWLVMKLVGLANNPSQRQRYRQEANRAAQQAKNTAQNFFQQSAAGAGRNVGGQQGASGAGQQSQSGAQQSSSTARQSQDAGAAHTYTYRYEQTPPQQKEQSQPRSEPWEVKDPREEKKKNPPAVQAEGRGRQGPDYRRQHHGRHIRLGHAGRHDAYLPGRI